MSNLVLKYTYRIREDEHHGRCLEFTHFPGIYIPVGENVRNALPYLNEAIARPPYEPPVVDKSLPYLVPNLRLQYKFAIRYRLEELGITHSRMADILGVDEKEARRLVDFKHSSTITALETALASIDGNAGLVFTFEEKA